MWIALVGAWWNVKIPSVISWNTDFHTWMLLIDWLYHQYRYCSCDTAAQLAHLPVISWCSLSALIVTRRNLVVNTRSLVFEKRLTWLLFVTSVVLTLVCIHLTPQQNSSLISIVSFILSTLPFKFNKLYIPYYLHILYSVLYN